jgi:hypothetical protein
MTMEACSKRGNHLFGNYISYTLPELKAIFDGLKIKVPKGTKLKTKKDLCRFLDQFNKENPGAKVKLMKYHLDKLGDELDELVAIRTQQLTEKIDQDALLIQELSTNLQKLKDLADKFAEKEKEKDKTIADLVRDDLQKENLDMVKQLVSTKDTAAHYHQLNFKMKREIENLKKQLGIE